MSTREEKIATLTDQQVLSIADSLAGEFASADAPEGRKNQIQVLQGLFEQEGEEVNVFVAAQADTVNAAAGARQLLLLMCEIPQIQPSLDEWLDNPPTQEAAAVPLVLAAPIVLTGCIVMLYVVGHVHFKRQPDGKWEIEYDATKPTPLDNTMKDVVQILANLMRAMIP